MGFLFGSPKVDNTVQNLMQSEAEAARLKEAERQAQLKTGMSSINNQFAGFGDDFYNARRNSVLDYYQPQLDDQMKKARDAMTFAFARAGTLNSTMAADRAGDLSKQYDLQKAGLVSNAQSDAANLQNAVQNQKSSLIGQLNATGDANQVANDATAATQQIYAQRPTYSPLGDIFSGVASGIGNMIGANQYASYGQTYNGGGGMRGGANAVRTVGGR